MSTRKLRILLVEDHVDTADMIATVLGLEGHDVAATGTVAAALAAVARDGLFDLVISDLGLPDRSGLDLMRELRASGCGLPGIALSGFGADHDLEQSRDAGFSAHLVKPAEPHQLLEAIQRVARERERPLGQ
jgi:CheY-like chemotaxis protein